MMLLFVVLLVLILVVLVLGAHTFVILSTGDAAAVERFGVFSRVLAPGIHFLMPMVERLRCVRWSCRAENDAGGIYRKTYDGYQISTRESTFDSPPVRVVTRDRVEITINPVTWYRVTDVRKVVYEVDDLYQGMSQIVATAVREAASAMTLEDVINGKSPIEESIHRKFEKSEEAWGIEITRIEVQDIKIPDAMVRATEQAVCAQREADARVVTEESKLRSEKLSAQRERDVKQLREEGEIALRMAKATGERDLLAMQSKSELALKCAEAQAEREMALESARSSAEATQLRARSEASAEELHGAAEASRVGAMIAAGATPDYLVAVQNAASWKTLAENTGASSRLIVPYEAARFLGAFQTVRALGTGLGFGAAFGEDRDRSPDDNG